MVHFDRHSFTHGWNEHLSSLKGLWDETYRREYSRIVGQDLYPPTRTPSKELTQLAYTPRPYQNEGIDFLRSHRRALNYDQAGMGKSLQGSMAAEYPCLISTRGYATAQWSDFLELQFPNAKIIDLSTEFPTFRTNSHLKRQAFLDTPPSSHGYDFVIMNIEMWQGYRFPHDYATWLLDESNLLKNRGAGRSINAKKTVTRDMDTRVYELTATPIVREADDLWMQLSILDPKTFSSYWKFVDAYMLQVQTPWGAQIVGVKPNMKKALRELFDRYAIGRTYKDVGLQLPRIIPPEGPKPLYSTMPTPLRKAYETVKKEYRLQWQGHDIPLSAAGEMTAILRQMTAHPAKWDVAYEKLDSLDWPPTIVFAHHKETCRAFAQYIHQKDSSVNPTVITGNIRAQIRLTEARKSNLVVATIDSLNDAVDLSHLRCVMFIEEDHTYGKMDSAIKRVWRFRPDESKDPILLFIVLMRNTVDVSIHKVAGRRFGTVRDVLNVELWEK